MDTVSLMDTITHLFASSLLLMFDCKHTFLFSIFLYLYTFLLFSLSQDLLGKCQWSKGILIIGCYFKEYYLEESPWNSIFKTYCDAKQY